MAVERVQVEAYNKRIEAIKTPARINPIFPVVLEATRAMISLAQGLEEVKPQHPSDTLSLARSLLSKATPKTPQEINAFAGKVISLEAAAREQEIAAHPEKKAHIENAMRVMKAYIEARGYTNADVLVTLVVGAGLVQFSQHDIDSMAKIAHAASEIKSVEFYKMVVDMPAIEIGSKHHEFWQKTNQYTERWKATDITVPGEAGWLAATTTYKLRHGEYPDAVTLLQDYRDQHEGRSPDGINDTVAGTTIIVDIKKKDFPALPPSKQNASIDPAKHALKKVREEQQAGYNATLVEGAKIIHNVIFDQADFALLGDIANPAIQIMHKLANENHHFYLENNGSYANGLTIQNYYDMLAIALGDWDKISGKARTENVGIKPVKDNQDIFTEVMDWAINGSDSPIAGQISLARRGQNSDDIIAEAKVALQQFAKGIIGANVEFYAQEGIKTDIIFPSEAVLATQK